MATNIDYPIGYCTNVHPSGSLTETIAQLHKHAEVISKQTQSLRANDGAMPIGLWLPAGFLAEALSPTGIEQLIACCKRANIRPISFNGFPYGNFHAEKVKHDVYMPSWDMPERYAYTIQAARLLAKLNPEHSEVTISTLPLGWGDIHLKTAASQLQKLARDLDQLYKKTGVVVRVGLEAEPGCTIDNASDMVSFFENYLLNNKNMEVTYKHIGVCHDICHSAVMLERQSDVFNKYKDAGINVVKTQISSALAIDFDALTPIEKKQQLVALKQFSEDRYLHQTVCYTAQKKVLYDDLSEALQAEADPHGKWRVHFHVPIHKESQLSLNTTQSDIKQWLSLHKETHFLEIETYAWHVMPSQENKSLNDSVVKEITWLKNVLTSQ